MKTRTLIFLLTVLVSFQTITAQKSKSNIAVTITNIDSADGTIKVGLYKQKENFLKQPYKALSIKAKKGKVHVVFENIQQGEYAISLYHDEDDNQKLNTIIGIPTEPYGTSNNAKGKFGPPKWEDAKFTLSDKNVEQSIQL
ncbi:DUF2141 domain-containing protein [Aquimarina sp. AD10]|uniref:DUF2141 domain-containing protein n=1 Tax=Aquimarina aggregata TaxID=1642818 RepID=A0A162XS68_9FLAO|nr:MULTISPECIES: DUF2141 domain-containing protein [Aquimarina]AXT60307.1 DUF2141 domain-containing protein [Aquimarina sp. AD10]KZS38744.1 hypothetical protein AWE51_14250 [Aquimarina aggregata]RKN01258.1 DUF2141 domain-containing protein [Aquimarina sp. AD10]